VSRENRKNYASVRLEPEILARVDTMIPRFTTAAHAGTRSDAMRALIVRGLEHLNDPERSALPALDADAKAPARIRR
jgi:hypothetical protein